jgi:hypothetical protein
LKHVELCHVDKDKRPCAEDDKTLAAPLGRSVNKYCVAKRGTYYDLIVTVASFAKTSGWCSNVLSNQSWNLFKVKTLTRFSCLFLFLFSVNALAQSAIRISFARNAISYEWRGTIANRGYQDFVLRLGRGQTFEVGGGHVYTWSATDPNGRKVGCNNKDYCSPGEGLYLQMSGDYVVHTFFRMDSGVNQPVASSRVVNLLFVAH